MAHDHLIELLDLDAEVLRDYHRELVAWVRAEAADRPRVVDLGAGSGTGTLALARELPGARITAVDVDPEMLAHLRARAGADASRIHTVVADLDRPWPDFGPTDVIWAAASMHHLADPGRAVAAAFDALRLGGLLLVAELDSFPRFLAGTPDEGAEERGHAELAKLRDEAGMHMHEDWGDRMTRAGFGAVTRRRFEIDLRPPLPAPGPRYAEVTLGRMRDRLADRLSTSDLAALAKAAGRADLSVRTTRTAWLARR